MDIHWATIRIVLSWSRAYEDTHGITSTLDHHQCDRMWKIPINSYQIVQFSGTFGMKSKLWKSKRNTLAFEASPELFCSVSSACPSDFRGCLILFCRHSFTIHSFIHSFIHSLSPLVKKTAHGGNQAVGRTLCLALAWDKMPKDRIGPFARRYFSMILRFWNSESFLPFLVFCHTFSYLLCLIYIYSFHFCSHCKNSCSNANALSK